MKDYLVQGYVLNGKKLKDQTSRIKELEKTLDIFSKVTESYQLKQDEFAREEIVTGVVTVIVAMGAGRKAAAAINEYLQSV